MAVHRRHFLCTKRIFQQEASSYKCSIAASMPIYSVTIISPYYLRVRASPSWKSCLQAKKKRGKKRERWKIAREYTSQHYSVENDHSMQRIWNARIFAAPFLWIGAYKKRQEILNHSKSTNNERTYLTQSPPLPRHRDGRWVPACSVDRRPYYSAWKTFTSIKTLKF